MRIRRPDTAALVSIALHLVLGAGLVRVVVMPTPLDDLFRDVPPPREERVDFVAVPRPAPATMGRDGGDDRAISDAPRSRASRPVVAAPVVVPTVLPPVAAAPAAVDDGGGSGERVGAGGPLRGIRPTYGDPRVWAPAGPMAPVPRAPAERLDSSLKFLVGRMNDSIAVAYGNGPSKLERGDWTIGRGDGRWGIDSSHIRLGKFSLPSSVLALLPLNVARSEQRGGGNPQARERARTLALLRADILYHSQRTLNEEELRVAAKRIRERKDRERKEQREARPAPPAPGPDLVP